MPGTLALHQSEYCLASPESAHVLACALAARAEAIVSGDDDLHALGNCNYQSNCDPHPGRVPAKARHRLKALRSREGERWSIGVGRFSPP
jgi:hypothetical protein